MDLFHQTMATTTNKNLKRGEKKIDKKKWYLCKKTFSFFIMWICSGCSMTMKKGNRRENGVRFPQKFQKKWHKKRSKFVEELKSIRALYFWLDFRQFNQLRPSLVIDSSGSNEVYKIVLSIVLLVVVVLIVSVHSPLLRNKRENVKQMTRRICFFETTTAKMETHFLVKMRDTTAFTCYIHSIAFVNIQ